MKFATELIEKKREKEINKVEELKSVYDYYIII
jgi:hypothetical protein